MSCKFLTETLMTYLLSTSWARFKRVASNKYRFSKQKLIGFFFCSATAHRGTD